jgi:hypothetical protein
MIAAGIAAALCASLARAVTLSPTEGDRLQRKIDEIVTNGSAAQVRPKKTPASENEINSYLAFNAKHRVPRGLAQPQLTILGGGRVAGRILVDLDEFKRGRSSGGLTDPWNYLSGQVPLTARGFLHAHGGKGQFQLEAAEIRSIPVPKPIVQELVTFFTRSAEKPDGIDIDAPFELPAKIREIAILKGAAVIAQ